MAESGAGTSHSDIIKLCDFIEGRQPEILAAWERRIHGLPMTEGLSAPTLNEHLPMLLACLSHALRGQHTHMPKTLAELPDKHALEWLRGGPDLRWAARELGALRDTILELWGREAGASASLASAPLLEVRQLNQLIDEVIADSVDHLAWAHEHTLHVLEQVCLVSGGMGEVDTLLRQLASVILETVDTVDSVALLLADDTGALQVRAAVGLAEGLQGFAEEVARRRAPLLLHHAACASLVYCSASPSRGLQALYGVPLIHEERVIGVAHMGSLTAFGFSVADQQLLRAMAQRATSLVLQAQRMERLRRSEAQLRAIIDHAPVAIYMKDEQGRYQLSNRRLEALLRRPREEILGKRAHDLLPREVADTHEANDRQVLRSGLPLESEEVVLQEDGPHTYLFVRFPLPYGQAQVEALCGISRDITERKRVEAALRETNTRLGAILDTAVDGIITIDARGIIQSINPATTRLFGYLPEELVGFNVSKLMPELHGGRHDQYLRGYLRTGARKVIGIGREVMGRRKDGSLFPLDLAVSEMVLGEGRYFTGMVRDISQRKAAEQAQALLVEAGTLLAQSLDLETTLENIVSLVVKHLVDCCLVDLLEESGQLHRAQVRAREPARQALLERALPFLPVAGAAHPAARALASGRPVTADITPELLEVVAQGAEQRALLEELSMRSVAFCPLIARGRKLGVLSLVSFEHGYMCQPSVLEVVRGVADRLAIAIDNALLYKQAQEASRLREQVVAIVSHDLRNPLNAIRLSVEALVKCGDMEERTAKAVARIAAAAHRAHRLIHDLLDFTQARVGGIPVCPKPGELYAIVRQVVEEVQSAHPERCISLRTHGDSHGEWDLDRVAQALANLIGNAVQHSPAATPVRVEMQPEEGSLTIEIHNQGPPIISELLPSLFEPFRRGQEVGSGTGGSLGLGLFICQRIVEAHGGSVAVRSTAEEGTTFTVRLPRRQPACHRMRLDA